LPTNIKEMSRRIVRKEEPFLARFKENPEDIWMTATDNAHKIWNVMYRYLGWILWRLFYIFIVLHKALTIQRFADDEYKIPSVSWKEIAILLGSLYLTWNCFMRYKDYQFFSRPDFEGPPSNTSHFHLADRVAEGPPGWAETGIGRLLYPIYAVFFTRPETSDQIWVMRTWEPRRYFLRSFCWFSPAQLIMYHIMTPGKAIYMSAAILTTAFFLRKLVDMFDAMLQDKQVIYGQMLAEYNENFIAPRVFVPKISHEVQTRGGFWDKLTEIKLNSKESISHQPIHVQSDSRYNSSKDYHQQPIPQLNSFGGNSRQSRSSHNNFTESRHTSSSSQNSTRRNNAASSSSYSARNHPIPKQHNTRSSAHEATLSTPITFSSSITTSSNITAPQYECPADKPSPYKTKDNIFQYGYGPISDYVEDWPAKNTS
ncbi:298_t:CDS:2, partial [Ambispora leptoticha]